MAGRQEKECAAFLAQFNFLDSKDLVGPLPGDVLLLFASNDEDWLSEPLHFEWMSSAALPIAITDSSCLLFPATVFHGAIHRTADYPDACEAASESDVQQSWNLPVLNGTKIGGRPHFIQSDDDLDPRPAMRVEDPFRPGKMMVVPARPSRHGFLCQLGSIQAAPEVLYPWCNHAQPLSIDSGPDGIYNESNSLVFYDMGNICIFRGENGDLWSVMEGY